jgi:hypothetical protein
LNDETLFYDLFNVGDADGNGVCHEFIERTVAGSLLNR